MINAFSSGGSGQSTIDGKWKLTGYSFTPKTAFPIEKMTIDLTVERNTRIGGRSGCNMYGGSVTFEPKGKMKVGPLTSTDMACDEMTNQFESLFTQTLQHATQYSLDGGRLVFTDPTTKNYLRFERTGHQASEKTAATALPIADPKTKIKSTNVRRRSKISRRRRNR